MVGRFNRIIVVVCTVVISACSGGGGGSGSSSSTSPSNPPSVIAPSGLSCASSTPTYTVGTQISANSCAASAGDPVTSFSISPSLPTGLNLNSSTGVISGTPTVVASQATYTVTASNGGGSATTTISLKVNDVPPSTLAYGTSTFTLPQGLAMPNQAATSSGGAIVSCASNPTLPQGLSLSSSCSLSGTPSNPSSATSYTITATNSGGTTSTSISISVYGYVNVSTNGVTSCAATTTGILKCWGFNTQNEVGDGGDTANRLSPVTADPGTSYISVSLGGYSGPYGYVGTTCGITSAGDLRCWGAGWLGNRPFFSNSPNIGGISPSTVSTGYSKISVASGNTCGITTLGNLKCWGADIINGMGSPGQAGPLDIDSGTTYTDISSGAHYNTFCGITTSGALKCWGFGTTSSYIGDGTMNPEPQASPKTIDPGVNYSKISVGYYATCGITVQGVLKCWGYNAGQVGDGTVTTRTSPVVIDSGTSYSQISVGAYNTCGITTSGVLKCWGPNYGYLGDGTSNASLSPKVIDPGVSYSQVSVGTDVASCGLTTSGVVKCWGGNASGGVGDGTTTDRLSPVVVD